MMEKRVLMGDLVQKLSHVMGVPHEASGWVLNGEQDTILYTQATKLLGPLIQKVGRGDFGSMQWAKVGQAVRALICLQNWWVISTLSFDEPRPACCATRGRKMHVHTARFFDDGLKKGKIGSIGEVKLYNWGN